MKKKLKNVDSIAFAKLGNIKLSNWLQCIGGALIATGVFVSHKSTKWFVATSDEGKEGVNKLYNTVDDNVKE